MNPLNDEPTEHQLVEAEMKLARTLVRLSALRRAALLGSYDEATFDRAVIEYKRAEAAVIDIRRAKARARPNPSGTGATPTVGAPPPAEPVAPLEPTPRLLFARWLVQTGRLSDWDTGEPELAGGDGVGASLAAPIVPSPPHPARAAA